MLSRNFKNKNATMKKIIVMLTFGVYSFVNRKDGPLFTIFYMSLFFAFCLYLNILSFVILFSRFKGRTQALIDFSNEKKFYAIFGVFFLSFLFFIFFRRIGVIKKLINWKNGPGFTVKKSTINTVTFMYVVLSYLCFLLVAAW